MAAICACSDVVYFVVDRRSRCPTLWGWVLIVLVGFLIYNHTYRNGGSSSQISGMRPILDIEHVNPKMLRKKHVALLPREPDPQEEEFQRILEKNKKGDQPLEVPIFNPDLHIKHEEFLPNGKPDPIHGPAGKKIIKPKPKEFPVNVIATPRVECVNNQVLLYMLVHTRPDHVGYRTAIRETWGVQDPVRYQMFHDIKWKTIFVTGRGAEKFNNAVDKEVKEHGDLLVGDFEDNEYEDTRKIMMSLVMIADQEADRNACKPRFIIKTEDKIYHNMVSIIGWLENKYKPKDDNIYVGKILRKDRPIRDEHNPKYVPQHDYRGEFFPDLIQSPVYMFDYKAFTTMRYFMSRVTPIAMEDGYIGLLAEAAKVKPKHNDHFQMVAAHKNRCVLLTMFFVYDITPHTHIKIFKGNKEARKSKECMGAKVLDKNNRHRDIII